MVLMDLYLTDGQSVNHCFDGTLPPNKSKFPSCDRRVDNAQRLVGPILNLRDQDHWLQGLELSKFSINRCYTWGNSTVLCFGSVVGIYQGNELTRS